jgi:superfamily II DNA helicase RecQ
MLHALIRKRLLVLLSIDEIHLFVQFGLYFRSEFLQLRTLLFDRVRLPNHCARMRAF